MRVVVIGATGNVGTSLLPELAREAAVDSVLGVARRLPELELPKTDWAAADIAEDDLVALLRGADVVVHLAWAIQPSRDRNRLWRTNVVGSTRVFQAVAEAGVGALVYASSVGAYSPGPKDRRVREDWPTGGVASSFYSRHKSEVERRLDRFEREHPSIRVVRMRPALIFKRESASEQRRLFAGPLLPRFLVQPGRLPAIPSTPRLCFQAVHSYDAGAAYRLAALGSASGAFNLAAEPVLDPPTLARALGSRTVPVPEGVLRAGAAATWRLRLQPTPPGWVDLALSVPLLDAGRALEELQWQPTRSGLDALLDVISGIRDAAGIETPPLSPQAGGPARTGEIASGVGDREDA